MINKYKKNKAFTLAEVLITLLIIGMVASLIIPSLLQETQNAEFKTAYKKAYADLEQATRLILLDNGGSFKNQCTTWDHNCLMNLYLPYLSYTKKCMNGAFLGNCWHNNGEFKRLNGTINNTWGIWQSGVILQNGSFLLFYSTSSACTYEDIECGDFKIDINGFKGPNTQGKDIFWVHLLEKSLKPYGCENDLYNPANTCIEGSTASSNSGLGCAAKYLYQ